VKRFVRRNWDLLLSLGVGVAIALVSPERLPHAFLNAMYGMGISVLSIIFSVFFAALAVIISAGDDEFVLYIRSLGLYERVLADFRFTLRLLFGALIYSIVVFGITAALDAPGRQSQPSLAFVIFAVLFLYSLLAALLSVGSALRYAQSRMKYLELMKKDRPTPDGVGQESPTKIP